MTATFGSLVDEVIHNLQGYSAKTDALASLEASIDASATQITLDDVAGFSRGTVQIDDELVYVKNVDSTSRQLVVPTWGRGFRGSTAATHDAGAMVTMQPTWPRATVAQKINEAIRELYPTLYAVKTTSFTVAPIEFAYAMPTGTLRVLDVRYRWPFGGADRNWERPRSWDVLFGQDPTDFPSGVALEVYDSLPPGAEIHVTYAAEPTTLADTADEFATTTGLNESVAALVVLGTTVKLLPNLDAARIPVESVSSDEADDRNPLGTASQTAQTFLRLYALRLEEEKRALDARYPARYRRIR